MTHDDDTLPGLDLPATRGGGVSLLEQAVARTLAALATTGDLDPERDAGMQVLATTLARAVDAGTRSGRASAVAMAARELRETLTALSPEAVGDESEWADFVQSLNDAAAADDGGTP